MHNPQEQYMRAAIAEALHSQEMGDYAVGACIVQDDVVVTQAGNRTHLDEDPTHHAEMLALRAAAKKLGRKNLSDCVLYSTHEPCPMCASAVIWAHVPQVISGARLEDMLAFAERSANEQWKWRTIPISATVIFQSVEPAVHFTGDFLRAECKQLFHA